MDIEKRLEILCEDGEKSLSAVNSNTRKLFQLLADDAKEFKFVFGKKHQDLINEIRKNGIVSDSASFIEDMILESERAKFADIDLLGVDRSRENLKSVIAETLDEHNKTDRGFVYFAWRSRPETYYYVGKAGSGARVNLDNHGKLLEALKKEKASRLSFIFPAKSTSANISNLEAALIHLVEFKTGDIPEENDRKEKLKLDYECGEELSAIQALIAQIHKQLE
jgi:hypothetical protein